MDGLRAGVAPPGTWSLIRPAPKLASARGDIVEAVRGNTIHRAVDVTRVLFHVGPWTEIRYELRRDGRTFETPLVTAPQENPVIH